MPTTTLYRPVGLHELALIWDTGLRAFPPRLAHQPIFYPVANGEYARQIARDWNPHDDASGYSGFVTRFDLENSFLTRFQPQVAGSSIHVEYWIPAAQLDEFNRNIRAPIELLDAFFGKQFRGYIPTAGEFQGRDAAEQFLLLSRLAEEHPESLATAILNNRKAVFLHSRFWQQADFSAHGIPREKQLGLLEQILAVFRA